MIFVLSPLNSFLIFQNCISKDFLKILITYLSFFLNFFVFLSSEKRANRNIRNLCLKDRIKKGSRRLKSNKILHPQKCVEDSNSSFTSNSTYDPVTEFINKVKTLERTSKKRFLERKKKFNEIRTRRSSKTIKKEVQRSLGDLEHKTLPKSFRTQEDRSSLEDFSPLPNNTFRLPPNNNSSPRGNPEMYFSPQPREQFLLKKSSQNFISSVENNVISAEINMQEPPTPPLNLQEDSGMPPLVSQETFSDNDFLVEEIANFQDQENSTIIEHGISGSRELIPPFSANSAIGNYSIVSPSSGNIIPNNSTQNTGILNQTTPIANRSYITNLSPTSQVVFSVVGCGAILRYLRSGHSSTVRQFLARFPSNTVVNFGPFRTSVGNIRTAYSALQQSIELLGHVSTVDAIGFTRTVIIESGNQIYSTAVSRGILSSFSDFLERQYTMVEMNTLNFWYGRNWFRTDYSIERFSWVRTGEMPINISTDELSGTEIQRALALNQSIQENENRVDPAYSLIYQSISRAWEEWAEPELFSNNWTTHTRSDIFFSFIQDHNDLSSPWYSSQSAYRRF